MISHDHLSVSPLAFSFRLHLSVEPLDWNSQLHLALVSLLRTAHCQLPSASVIYSSQFQLSCTAHLHLSVAPLSFEPLHFTFHVHLSVSPLVCNSHERSQLHLSLEHFVCICRLQFSFETLIRASWLHSSLPLGCCTWFLHLLLATLKFTSHGQLSFTPLNYNSYWNLSCNFHVYLAVSPLI